MLQPWMADNKFKKWSIGLNLVQFQKSSSFYRIIGCSPYKILFGNDSKIRLGTSNLPSFLMKKLTIKEDLEHIYQIKEIIIRSIACSIVKLKWICYYWRLLKIMKLFCLLRGWFSSECFKKSQLNFSLKTNFQVD